MRALDPDGFAVVGSGTVAFAVGAVVCWIFLEPLSATGRQWYLYVAIVGTLIGIVGLGVGFLRRQRRQRPNRALAGQPQTEEPLVEEPLIDADGVPDRD